MSLSPDSYPSLSFHPGSYPRIKIVGSFEELVTTSFSGQVNALCWPRILPGDFGEIASLLASSEDIGERITTLDEARLNALPLSAEGRIAREILFQDQQRLLALELQPNIDCVRGSVRDSDLGPVPTDVFSFHVDSATVQADTYLCTYHGACSEGLSNEEAQRRVNVPETRAELLKEFGGADDEDFIEFLNDCYYDLHYVPLTGAQPFSFGIGNLWRIALDYPGNPVLPCIHRAPLTAPGDPLRLLLIS